MNLTPSSEEEVKVKEEDKEEDLERKSIYIPEEYWATYNKEEVVNFSLD